MCILNLSSLQTCVLLRNVRNLYGILTQNTLLRIGQVKYGFWHQINAVNALLHINGILVIMNGLTAGDQI